MMCNCRCTEGILGAIVLIVTIWPNLLGAPASWWVVVAAAAVLLLHAIFHHMCGCDMCMDKGMPSSRKKRR